MSYQVHIMRKTLSSSYEGLPSLAAPKWGPKTPNSAQHMTRLRVFIISSRGHQTTRNWIMGVEPTREWSIGQYPILATSKRVFIERIPAGHQHSGGQTASSLLDEWRTWASTAGGFFRKLLSTSGCLMNCLSPLNGCILVWRTSVGHLKSDHTLFMQHWRKSFIFQILSFLFSYLNILYQLCYLSKATAIVWFYITIS